MLTNSDTTMRATLMGHRNGNESLLKHHPTHTQIAVDTNSTATRM